MTRSLADKSSFGTAENEKICNQRSCRYSADPPKKNMVLRPFNCSALSMQPNSRLLRNITQRRWADIESSNDVQEAHSSLNERPQTHTSHTNITLLPPLCRFASRQKVSQSWCALAIPLFCTICFIDHSSHICFKLLLWKPHQIYWWPPPVLLHPTCSLHSAPLMCSCISVGKVWFQTDSNLV